MPTATTERLTCPSGRHSLTDVYTDGKGTHYCKACKREAMQKLRQSRKQDSQCSRGHLQTEDNVRTGSDGRRYCYLCRKESGMKTKADWGQAKSPPPVPEPTEEQIVPCFWPVQIPHYLDAKPAKDALLYVLQAFTQSTASVIICHDDDRVRAFEQAIVADRVLSARLDGVVVKTADTRMREPKPGKAEVFVR